ncbi:hypothetical protein KP17_20520 [Pectobacterium parvum]|nr:hypothetical protein KP17_20520 [Pectobacterium parvum]
MVYPLSLIRYLVFDRQPLKSLFSASQIKPANALRLFNTSRQQIKICQRSLFRLPAVLSFRHIYTVLNDSTGSNHDD